MPHIKLLILIAVLGGALVPFRPLVGWAGFFIVYGVTILAIIRAWRCANPPAREWNTAEIEAERKDIERMHAAGKDIAPIRLVEYLIQRYGAVKAYGQTQAEYDRAIQELERRGEEGKKNHVPAPFIPYQSPTINDTTITREEFFKYVVPHVRLLRYWPEGYGSDVDAAVAEDLWQWTGQGQQDAWKIQQALFEKWGHLNYDWQYATKATLAARRQYCLFKASKEHGHDTIMVFTDRHHCGINVPDEISVADLERGYRKLNRKSLIVPFPRCPFNGRDGGGLCVCHVGFGPAPLREGDSAEFAAWFKKRTRKKRRRWI